MKVNVVVAIFLSLILTSCGQSLTSSEQKSDSQTLEMTVKETVGQNEDNISKKYPMENNVMSNKNFDVVADKEMAAKIAEIILTSAYGEKVQEKKPFKITFDGEHDAWIIEGQLKKGQIGGVPKLIIEKKDGRVIYISHSK